MQKILIVIATFFLLSGVYSQVPAIQWQTCYGGPGTQYSKDIQQTIDGGYITCGYNSSQGLAARQFWIIKFDAAGVFVWEKFLGGSGADEPYKIRQTSEGGYIVVGSTGSNDGDVTNNHGELDFWVVKLNSLGNITWQKTFGGSLWDRGFSVEQTNDGGYILAGETESLDGDVTNNHGMFDFWVLKLDNAGNLLWQKTFGGSNYDQAYSVRQTTDEGYIVSGNAASSDGDVSNPNAPPGGRAWLVKLDNSGSIQWQHSYGTLDGGAGAESICLTNDGGYCFTGANYGSGGDVTGNHGSYDLWVVKVNATGALVWQKSFGGSALDYGKSILPRPDGGFVVGGWVQSSDGDVIGYHGGVSGDYWIAGLSASGGLEWQKPIGGSSSDQLFSMCATSDGGYASTGVTSSSNSGDVGLNTGGVGSFDMWLVKLNSGLIPIKLSQFDAATKGSNVICTWKTQQEQNSSHFIIERSQDAAQFVPLGRVQASGISTGANEYDFIDANPFSSGERYLYYRLKMVDLDGSSEFSRVVRVELRNASRISVYPNPVSESLLVEVTSRVHETRVLMINDDAGRKVLETTVIIRPGVNKIPIRTALVPSGCYFLTFKGKNSDSVKFLKQ